MSELFNSYYSQDKHGPFQLFQLGDFGLEEGWHASRRPARLHHAWHAECG